jgi:hypothetical protein
MIIRTRLAPTFAACIAALPAGCGGRPASEGASLESLAGKEDGAGSVLPPADAYCFVRDDACRYYPFTPGTPYHGKSAPSLIFTRKVPARTGRRFKQYLFAAHPTKTALARCWETTRSYEPCEDPTYPRASR